MHWSLEKAEELIKENPNLDEFVCASGISPSGHIHIGNFRELVTTYFVVLALRRLGKKARFIFSWDDYDRFRKVPKNIDSSYEKYLGLPYSEIPDPFGCCESYARHFENEFESAIKDFRIAVEFIYQSKEYKGGKYNSEIIHALNYRRKIYDILMEYKTQKHSEKERQSFYPITIYCHKCGKDNTTVLSYSEVTNIIKYACTCGSQNVTNVKEADNIKLNWKVDWPMRWNYEGVIFEPGGRDHSSVGGSFEVSSRVAKEIFNYTPPNYIAYEFIGIKGTQGKMSSSLGNLITPSELLKVYTPEIILYIFSKYHPSAAFNFGFDEEVIRNYTEFERFREKYKGGELEISDIMLASMELSDLARPIDDYPSISKIADLLPILNYDVVTLKEVLEKSGEIFSNQGLEELSKKIEYWIKNWSPSKAIKIRETKNNNLLHGLTREEKVWIDRFLFVIDNNNKERTIDSLMEGIYSITRTDNPKETKQNQKRFFKILYQLLIDQTQGPRLPVLIRVIGTEKVKELISI